MDSMLSASGYTWECFSAFFMSFLMYSLTISIKVLTSFQFSVFLCASWIILLTLLLSVTISGCCFTDVIVTLSL